MRKTPLTLGVLSMVFGGLVAAYSAFGLVFSSIGTSFMSNLGSVAATAPRRPGQPDPTVMFARMTELMKELAPYNNAILAAKVLFSVALIVIGFGLYKRKRWGRSGAMAWGALALLELAGELIVRVGVIQPRVNAVLQEMFAASPNGAPPAAIMQAMGSTQTSVTVILGLLFYAPFPIVLLALCGRRSAAADFVD
jgi:hypothetical protein